jgi:hypothetical protein
MKSRLAGIVEEAEASGFFDFIHAFTLKDLDSDFLQQHKVMLASPSRGCGYWIYKAQIVLQTFINMKDGDILAYADAGCGFNKNFSSLPRALSMLEDQSIPLVCYSMPHVEHSWTKADTLNAMDVFHNLSITETGQVAATAWLIEKSPRSAKFIQTWKSWMEAEAYHLVDDSPSVFPNHFSFRDHRHDQSIFSILTKLHGIRCTSQDETWPPQSALSPITAARCKERHCF